MYCKEKLMKNLADLNTFETNMSLRDWVMGLDLDGLKFPTKTVLSHQKSTNTKSQGHSSKERLITIIPSN